MQRLIRRSSTFPWTYAESWLAGRRARSQFEQVRLYVMFIGQPRSGTSLIGSILNAHRHILIAQELNTLRYVARGYRRDQLFWLIQARDQEFQSRGRVWTGYDYDVPGQWQGRCESLYVIGDKKAAASTELLGKYPYLLDCLEEEVRVPVRILHVVRNPFNVIATIHRKRKNTSLRLAVSMYFDRCKTNWHLMQSSRHTILTIRLEDVISQPIESLTTMCSFLGLTDDPDYLEACSKKLFASPRQTQSEIAWPGTLVREISERIREYPFLAEYAFQGRTAPDDSRDETGPRESWSTGR